MEQLQKQIDELKREIQQLKSSSTIPRDIQTAFEQRLGTLGATGTGSASTQNIAITSTPQTITVVATPSGTLAVTYKGVTYNLLYK